MRQYLGRKRPGVSLSTRLTGKGDSLLLPREFFCGCTRRKRKDKVSMDLSIFATPEAWISLITLLFLEIVLGVDNLVFIAITTDRLPPEKQHIGRKLGLLGALARRSSAA